MEHKTEKILTIIYALLLIIIVIVSDSTLDMVRNALLLSIYYLIMFLAVKTIRYFSDDPNGELSDKNFIEKIVFNFKKESTIVQIMIIIVFISSIIEFNLYHTASTTILIAMIGFVVKQPDILRKSAISCYR